MQYSSNMPWGGGQVSSDLYVDDGQKVNAFM